MKKLGQSKQHILAMIVPVVLCVVYLALCTLNLNGAVWFDESYSAYLIRGDFGQIWSLTAVDVHPPLFYFLLKVWSLIFGTSDIALRFMSVFFGGVGIIFAFHLVKKWFGLKVATVGTTLLALSPMLIRYGQEMRMYTLVFAIIVAATYVLELALENPTRKRYWILYAILVAVGMWTHYFTALAWLAQAIYLIFVRKQNIFKRPLITTYLLAVALYLPWIPSLFSQVKSVQGGFWIPEVSAVTPVDYFTNVLFFKNADDLKDWLVPLFLIVVILTTFMVVTVYRKLKKTEMRSFIGLLLLVFLPPALLILLSMPPLKPMFIDRYVLYSASLFWLMAGSVVVLAQRKLKILPVAFAGVMLISAGVGIVNVETREPAEDIKSMVKLVDEMSESGEPILMNRFWNYYNAIPYSTDEHPIYIANEWVKYEYGSQEPIREYHYNVVDDLGEFMGDVQEFWYIADKPEEGEEIVAPIDGYRIVNEIAQGDYVALGLEKE